MIGNQSLHVDYHFQKREERNGEDERGKEKNKEKKKKIKKEKYQGE